MRRPQLESRSLRYAARQNVADFEELKGVEMSDGVKAEAVLSRDKGEVKFFDVAKGFGFCKRDGGLPDVFVHANALKRSGIEGGVKAGDKLEFDVLAVDGKGPKGDNFKVLSRVP